MSCNNTDPVIRNYVHQTDWDLHHRTAYDSCGYGTHGGTHNEEFNRAFHTLCGNAFYYIYLYTPWDYQISWVGDIGVTVCKPGWHGYGRAFDLSQIRFTNGEFIDMNRDWRGTTCAGRGGNFKRRQYIGVWAGLRRYAGRCSPAGTTPNTRTTSTSTTGPPSAPSGPARRRTPSSSRQPATT